MTHTYATLPVTRDTYNEVADKLREAEYGHAFINEGEGEVIDMHGIALQAQPAPAATLAERREARRANYTCCFVFDDREANVLLIRKSHPAWQEGKLNGIGGKIEPGETPYDCARREVREEAGIDVPGLTLFARLRDADALHPFEVFFFRASVDASTFYCAAEYEAPQSTDHDPEFIEVSGTSGNDLDIISEELIPNLNYLIPMALNMPKERAVVFEIVEHYGNPIDRVIAGA